MLPYSELLKWDIEPYFLKYHFSWNGGKDGWWYFWLIIILLVLSLIINRPSAGTLIDGEFLLDMLF